MGQPQPSDDSNPISVIAHKLRTPLTVIMSTVDNLLDGAFGKISPEQAKWLKKLESHTTHLEGLLNDILNMLKQDQGKSEALIQSLEQKGGGLSESKSPTSVLNSSSMETGGAAAPKILVVDDEQDILDVIQEGLGMQGLKTVATSNGEEAVRLALEMKPDLILMDVQLKGQNGIELCREIKSKLSSFTPVILVTGQDDLREKLSGSHFEADDLLTKPFQMVELFARVASMLRIKKLHQELERLKQKG